MSIVGSSGTGTAGVSRLEVRVLGPIEILWDGQPIDVGGIKTKALVARLLIDRNLTVSVDRLLDALWSEGEGDGAEIALRSTVSRLRKRLRDAGVDVELIVTRPPGYVLQADPDTIDVFRFERMLTSARQLLNQDNPQASSEVLVEALSLWRGPAFGEVRDEPFARPEARRLEELQLSALETRVDAELALGRHNDLIGELESLTHANPMRERLWTQRMLALYRSGRQGEALRVFQELRTILVDELGIDPGTDIARLEQEILNQNPDLDWNEVPQALAPEVAMPFSSSALAFPTTANESPFVGRDEELGELANWWHASDGGGRLALVGGEPGIGKTRLGIEIGRRVSDEGALVMWGHCDEDPIGPYQPFAEALNRYFQSLPAATIAETPAWRLTELARLILKLRKYAPARTASDVTDPEGERFRFFEAVTDTLVELCETRRVLLVLDNMHWADRPTLLLLRHLLRNSDTVGPSIVGLYRDTDLEGDHPLPELLADLRTERPPLRVGLRGLAEPAVQELLNLSSSDATPELAHRLYQMTDGNPLMLDEMLRQIGPGKAEELDGAPMPPELDTPEAVKELVARRVSRLPDEVIHFLQAAAVAGFEFEASIAASAAGLSPDERLDAIDRAVESRLLRESPESGERYLFTHALMRDAIYGELLRGRRVRLHHKIALAIEAAHPESIERYLNELAHHFCHGASLADAEKAVTYSFAAGDRALGLLAFEEAVEHYTRGIEALDLYGQDDPAARCDALLALAEAQNKAGSASEADASYEAATTIARRIGDAERLAKAALRAGPMSYMGIVEARPDLISLLEEAREAIGPEDSHLRAMVNARLALVNVYAQEADPELLRQALSWSAEAIAIARRLGDRAALGYGINARLHALWGIDPAPERLAAGTELGQIANEVHDELLALHGHMWRVRELLAQGDVDSVHREIQRFEESDTGPRHPLASAYACNVRSMMALIQGETEDGEKLALEAMELGTGHNDLAFVFYGAQMSWTWWQKDGLAELEDVFQQVLDQAPEQYPIVNAALALLLSETDRLDQARVQLDLIGERGWDRVAYDQTEGVAIAFSAAVCGAVGASEHAPDIYRLLRPYAGTAIVIRAPAAACLGPADLYLGLVANSMGDTPLAEVHFEAALRLAERMRTEPFIADAQLQLAITLLAGEREEDVSRAGELLDQSIKNADHAGLLRIARIAQATRATLPV